MSDCTQLAGYLARTLAEPERQAFGEHLGRCEVCRERVAKARVVDSLTAQWLDSLRSSRDVQVRAAECVVSAMQQARNRQGARFWQRAGGRGSIVLAAASVAVVSAAAVLLVYILWSPDTATMPDIYPSDLARLKVLHAAGAASVEREPNQDDVLSVSGDGQLLVALDGDRIGLPKGSMVVLRKSRSGKVLLRLRLGAVVVDAVPRGARGALCVEVGAYMVTVVGTRFQVERGSGSSFTVSVRKGQVKVTGTSGLDAKVSAGQRVRFVDGRIARRVHLTPEVARQIDSIVQRPQSAEQKMPGPKAPATPPASAASPPTDRRRVSRSRARTPPLPDLSTIERWVLSGRVSTALKALLAHLKRSPRDLRSWALLAVCYRKGGQWREAVRAYGQVTRLGGSRQANRARFEAARLLQTRLGQHRAAAQLLRSYLRKPRRLRPLSAEALIRLARSLLSMGKRAAAGEVLSRLIKEHPGTIAAIQARRLLRSATKRRKGGSEEK